MNNLINIPGYSGRYQLDPRTNSIISNSKWSKGRIMEVFTNRQGEKRVNLCINGRRAQYKLQELIHLTLAANGNT